MNGFVYRLGNLICVSSIYIAEGGVNFKTGNIDYDGDVLVRGDVLPGFTVSADGNINIEGAVEAATITSRNGSIVVR
jgi:uncharacterized protein (DUF342 family)